MGEHQKHRIHLVERGTLGVTLDKAYTLTIEMIASPFQKLASQALFREIWDKSPKLHRTTCDKA